MGNCVNQVYISGCAGKDAEIRTTGGGMNIATFSLAISDGKKDAAGNWVDNTVWANIKAFGKLADVSREKVQKGAKVFVDGRLTVEEWTDKTSGQKRSKTVIVANYLSVVPSARTSGASQEPAAGSYQRSLTPREQVAQSTEITDEDIPF